MDEALKKQIEEVTTRSDPEVDMSKRFPTDESYSLLKHRRLLKVFRICKTRVVIRNLCKMKSCTTPKSIDLETCKVSHYQGDGEQSRTKSANVHSLINKSSLHTTIAYHGHLQIP